MADQEHLAIINRGSDVWNIWRKNNPGIRPDLSGADLYYHVSIYEEIDPCDADLFGANLSGVDLSGADLSNVGLYRANLVGANLSGANLVGANLSSTKFRGAVLHDTNLSSADLHDTNLSGADLSGANLYRTDLSGANLSGANLSYATAERTIFGDIDLHQVKGLEEIFHHGPSTIGIDTLMKSQGDIPTRFLKGAGVSDELIEYARSLTSRAIEYYTCFISYCSQDQNLVEHLYADLQNKGVRCWYAPEDMKIGDKIRQCIDESIRLYDKLLLVLSEHSIQSEWVEFEVEAALDKERTSKKLVLFPIRLDDSVMNSQMSWATHLRRTRHIGNFSKWEQYSDYQKAFARLLRDLQSEGKPKSE